MSIINSRSAFRLLRPVFSIYQEEFWAVALNSSKELLAQKLLFRGTVDACLVHPRDLFRFAIDVNASALIVAHNHPTGEAKPSGPDRALTTRLVECGSLMSVPILDHLILAKDSYFSFLDEGSLLRNWEQSQNQKSP